MLEQKLKQWANEFRQEGREAGRREGELTILFCLIKQRFGRVPTPLKKQMLAMTDIELPMLTEKILEAESVKQLINDIKDGSFFYEMLMASKRF